MANNCHDAEATEYQAVTEKGGYVGRGGSRGSNRGGGGPTKGMTFRNTHDRTFLLNHTQPCTPSAKGPLQECQPSVKRSRQHSSPTKATTTPDPSGIRPRPLTSTFTRTNGFSEYKNVFKLKKELDSKHPTDVTAGLPYSAFC